MQYQLHHGDCLAVLAEMPDSSVDSIVTDPPYELGFMGKSWDASGIAYNVDMWREALRVLKPGGHLLAFSGSRTYHRMTCAIEDAGFEIRDQIMWVYGSGFPKSLDVSKAIDKAAGAERKVIGPSRRHAGRSSSDGAVSDLARYGDAGNMLTAPATDAARQWEGWGTALKPAHEPICVARKPLVGTVAANVLEFGTGALNIDGCRVETSDNLNGGAYAASSSKDVADATSFAMGARAGVFAQPAGRWPANLIHDGSPEVVALFPESTSGAMKAGTQRAAQDKPGSVCFGTYGGAVASADIQASSGSAARFFYCAKASKSDRGADNNHPTVKPSELMRYLVRLVTPPGGVVLDPFMGSGSTGKAAMREGFRFVGIDMTAEYVEIARARIEHALFGDLL